MLLDTGPSVTARCDDAERRADRSALSVAACVLCRRWSIGSGVRGSTGPGCAARSHGHLVSVAGRLDVDQQPRRRHGSRGRPAADRLADAGSVARRAGRSAAASAVAAVRPLCGRAGRPRRPATHGRHRRSAARHGPGPADRDAGDRVGEHRCRARCHAAAGDREGLCRHGQGHAAADGRRRVRTWVSTTPGS